MPRSPAITSAKSGGNAIPQISILRGKLRGADKQHAERCHDPRRADLPYQLQNAIMKPNHEKKKTRP
ncbi:hypothetical protein K491DRAFT_38083 [Lophiostoma macrostomum CBS 122681]|uniref:Uncharacterized protein n=1 Tax=Lophiostoma macrostomum CBS 122681 TaxID=1314788 RepID=A0A6A6TLA6_9PLEO|nr:hypothetical protein K491DRAFT_38083 [Lophiostoma macrostomum CBS 122681]